MKKILIVFLFIFIPFSVNADDNIKKVFKLEAYQYNEFSDSFELIQYGSAVYINKGLIYTNAHVVLDYDNKPIGNYKVCKTINFKDKPQCFTVGKLLYYDTKKDLAILQIGDPSIKTVKFSNKKLDIGDVVKVYGYPSNGGETITYTEGKISGYEDGLYKIDANIDSGNSGGGVFDSDGNLIGIAVSVRVGYTTLGYIIPNSDIKDFQQRKNKSNIEIYNKKTDPKFVFYTVLSKKAIGATKFNNLDLEIKDFKKYGYVIDDYNINNSREFFKLILKNKENDVRIEIGNGIIYSEKKISLDYIHNESKKEIKKILSINKDYLYKSKKVKISNKNALLEILTDKKEFIVIVFNIEISKNNFQTISIISDKINKKAINNALRIVLKKLIFNHNTKTKTRNVKLYNLTLGGSKDFFIAKRFGFESLEYILEDIEINIDSDIETKFNNENDYTLSSYINMMYSFLKDFGYYNFIGIKETKSGDKYFYYFMLNNKTKSGKENKNAKKYGIVVNFLENKNEKKYYSINLTFTFDKIKSKKIIDDFINNIKTQSGVSPFKLGDLEIGENLIEKEEFEFKDSK